MKNTFVKVLSFVMALMMVVGTFSTLAVFADDCTHENSTVVAEHAASCVSIGYTEYKCNDCGEEYVANVSPKLPFEDAASHVLVSAPATDATCDKPGTLAGEKCSVAGCTYTTVKNDDSKPALGHKFVVDYEQTANCEQDGFKAKKCAVCGAIDESSKKDVVKAAHKLVYTLIVAPTACTNGSYKVTCSVCDKVNETIIEEADHDWIDMPATSTDNKVPCAGTTCIYTYKSGKYCKDCYVVHPEAVKNDKPTHDAARWDANANGVLDAAELNADVEALGFQLGDKVYVDATCTEAGYELVYCKDCKTYIKKVVPIALEEGHNWSAWTFKAGTTVITEEQVKADQFHAFDKIKTRECSVCDLKQTELVLAATAHKYEAEKAVVKTEMTCETNGFTTYKCDLCAAESIAEVVYATGHTFTEWKNAEGFNCKTNPVQTRVCTNEHCNVKDGKVETRAIDAADHKFVKTTVPATCIADAYYINKCSVCSATADYVKTDDNDKPAAGKDATNHVVKDKDTTQAKQKLEVVQEADCLNPEKTNFVCACDVLVTVVTADAKGHTEGKIYDNKTDNTKDKDYSDKASTCKTQGQKDGKLCTVCGADIVVPTKLPLDPKNHEGDKSQVGDLVPATCVAKAYTNYYFSCCKAIEKVESGEIAPNAHQLENKAAVPATCTTKGTEAYKACKLCAKLFDLNGEEIDAPKATDYAGAEKDGQHAWGDEIAVDPETCTETGFKAHKICADCGAYLIDGVAIDDEAKNDKGEYLYVLAGTIAAHGGKYMGRFVGLNNPKDLSCTTGAYGANKLGLIPDELICEKCVLPLYWTAALEHKGTEIEKTVENNPLAPKYDCTKATFTVNTCECGYKFVTGYDAPETAHKFKGDDGKYLDKNPAISPANCTDAGKISYACQNPYCSVTADEAGDPATGHKTTVGGATIDVSFDCADWEINKGLTCTSCGKTVSKDTVKHSGEKTYGKDATCTADGYKITSCTACVGFKDGDAPLYNEKSEFLPKFDHKGTSTLISAENGVETYFCTRCQTSYEIIVLDMTTSVVTDATVVAAGSTATVTVNATVNALSFTQLFFTVDTKGAFEITDVELVAAFEGANVHADLTKDGFVIYTENNAAGETVYATLNGENVALVTLTLSAAQFANGKYDVTATASKAVIGFDEEGKEKTADLHVKSEKATLAVSNLGDLNGDSIIGVSDIQALIPTVTAAVAAGTYNANADLNKDGVVDQFDVAAIRLFMKKGFTAAAYIEMIGEDLDAAIASLKITDVADAILFEAYVNEQLTVNYAEYLEALEYFGNLEGIVKALYLEMHA